MKAAADSRISRRGLLRVAGASAFCALPALLLHPVAHAARTYAVQHSDAEWQSLLTPQQFGVLRRAGTERPYTSPLNQEKRAGVFTCAGCQQALFSSATKFESGTGWPSFWKPLPGAVDTDSDTTFGMRRDEVLCSRCGGHLGHVFNDGPKPTGLRYCMNGVSLAFAPGAAPAV